MWKLSGRDNKIRQWAELGEFQSIAQAARRGLELEGDPHGSLFFRVYADPLCEKSDAELLYRLEYQSAKGIYLLQRAAHQFYVIPLIDQSGSGWTARPVAGTLSPCIA